MDSRYESLSIGIRVIDNFCKNRAILFRALRSVSYLLWPTYPKFSAASVRAPPQARVDTALRNKKTTRRRKAGGRRANSRHETNAGDRILFALARPADTLRRRTPGSGPCSLRGKWRWSATRPTDRNRVTWMMMHSARPLHPRWHSEARAFRYLNLLASTVQQTLTNVGREQDESTIRRRTSVSRVKRLFDRVLALEILTRITNF